MTCRLGGRVAIDDPEGLYEAWTITVPFDLLPDTEIIENICENERDVEKIKGIRP